MIVTLILDKIQKGFKLNYKIKWFIKLTTEKLCSLYGSISINQLLLCTALNWWFYESRLIVFY